MEEELKENLKAKGTWKRGLLMLLFAIIYSVTEVLLVAVVIFQFGARLITGKTNQRLLNLGQSLATYIYQIILFETFKTEEMPYPFEVWPKGAPAAPAKPKRRKAPARKPKAAEEPAAENNENDGG